MRLRRDQDGRPTTTIDRLDFDDRINTMIKLNPARAGKHGRPSSGVENVLDPVDQLGLGTGARLHVTVRLEELHVPHVASTRKPGLLPGNPTSQASSRSGRDSLVDTVLWHRGHISSVCTIGEPIPSAPPGGRGEQSRGFAACGRRRVRRRPPGRDRCRREAGPQTRPWATERRRSGGLTAGIAAREVARAALRLDRGPPGSIARPAVPRPVSSRGSRTTGRAMRWRA